ncbi:MAG: YbhB/YbcL family Raf kinase inhibitor-like protein [Candidatus Liptonbacteria bacterium]|nr:YbhB/YbcL family Raf kinase inhibitor-like protein [Candidatus Liptonbacteria bacterium]
MNISSTEFNNNESIPVKFTCQGDNINPRIEISGVPDDAKSLALIMDDPDAPVGTFTHWLIWNIDPKTAVMAENSVPGIQGKNSAGSLKYIGPCPPSGVHRYFFRLYALDSMLDLSAGTEREQLELQMSKHILERTEFIGTYKKI